MDTDTALRFGDYEFDAANAVLTKGGVPIRLRPQAFNILSLLIRSAGQLVTRERIRQEIWGTDTFVDFNQGLNVCIRQIRDALGDDADVPRYIETVPKLGYKFIAPVASAIQGGEPIEAAAAESLQPPASASVWHRLTGQQTRAAILAVAGLLAVASIAGLVWRLRDRVPSNGGPIRSLAVLPLVNLSAETEQDYFVEGMTDALITDLAQIRALKVISRSSVTQYKDAGKRLPEIGRDLGVDAVVQGTVQRVGTRVRVNVRLVRAATDEHVWAQTYERSVGDILILERDIARAVAVAVRAALTPQEHSRLAVAPTADPVAYEAYLKGRHFWNTRSAAGLETAVKYFKEAIARDPNYAPAYAGLADCYGLGPGLRIPVSEAMSIARAAASKALELDGTLAEAHSSLALVELFFDWNMQAAGERFRRAIDLNPGYATGHQMYAEYLAINGRIDEALAEIARARELDPLSLIISRDVGRILYFGRRYDEAAAALRSTLAVDATFTPARFVLAFAYERSGKQREALAEFEEMAKGPGARALMKGALGYAYGTTANVTGARRILKELTESSGPRPPAYDVALVYLGLGDRDGGFEWLERAADERAYRIVYIGADPIFDGVRSDPRFERLLERAGLRAAFPHAN